MDTTWVERTIHSYLALEPSLSATSSHSAGFLSASLYSWRRLSHSTGLSLTSSISRRSKSRLSAIVYCETDTALGAWLISTAASWLVADAKTSAGTFCQWGHCHWKPANISRRYTGRFTGPVNRPVNRPIYRLVGPLLNSYNYRHLGQSQADRRHMSDYGVDLGVWNSVQPGECNRVSYTLNVQCWFWVGKHFILA